MEARHIIGADFLDILFEHRNKSYGAYELRRSYTKRLLIALLAGLLLCGALLASIILIEPPAAVNDQVSVREVVIQQVDDPKPATPPPPPEAEEPPPPKAEKIPPRPEAPPPPKISTTRFTPPVVKKDAEVRREEIPPVKAIDRVGLVTTEGRSDEGIIQRIPPAPATIDKGTGIVQASKKQKDENKIFEKVEIEARVDITLWRRHLERNLQRYIEDAARQGMDAGRYTVQVRFLVEKDGSINNVRALNSPGFGLSQAAVQVVKRGPRWRPGEQNGRKVRSYHTQPITFVIADGY